MAENYFDKNYSEYWKERVGNTADGSKVPNEKVEHFFISKLSIKDTDTLLDLGCGHGRLYPLLRGFTEHIEGIDINQAALDEAALHPYTKLKVGSAEETNLPAEQFEKIVAWASYDGVEQEKGLVEANRILKTGGSLLITGKNKDYEPEDDKAFIAERNAKLKNFPNHFTDVYGVIKDAALFGFDVIGAYGFVRRGDFGEMNYIDLLKEHNAKFYEFLLILKKVSNPAANVPTICYEFSDRAQALAKENNLDDVKAFFAWHKEKYHD